MTKRTRKMLTEAIVIQAARGLQANIPYSEIARDLRISPATLGRIKGAMEGRITKDNANIARLLETAKNVESHGMGSKTTPGVTAREEDTHGLSALLAQLESDLAKLKVKCQQIRQKL